MPKNVVAVRTISSAGNSEFPTVYTKNTEVVVTV